MEYMERQLASLTGLVQKALTTGGPPGKQPQPPNQQQLQQIPTRDCDQGKAGGNISKYIHCAHLLRQIVMHTLDILLIIARVFNVCMVMQIKVST